MPNSDLTIRARAVLAGLRGARRRAVEHRGARSRLRTLRAMAREADPLFVEVGEEWPTQWERTPLGRECARLLAEGGA